MADFDPRGTKTAEPILMKLGMVDYVRDPTPRDNFGRGSATCVVWANVTIVTSLSFFSFFFFAFFATRPGRPQLMTDGGISRSLHQSHTALRNDSQLQRNAFTQSKAKEVLDEGAETFKNKPVFGPSCTKCLRFERTGASPRH